MAQSGLLAVVLAAGLGTRMKSDRVKVLHPLAGEPMITYLLDTLSRLDVKTVAVVGHQREEVERVVGDRAMCVVQDPPLGTGHALLQAQSAVDDDIESVLVLNGDTPLVTEQDLWPLIEHHRRYSTAATVVTAVMDNPYGYGRIVRDGDSIRVVEQSDLTDDQQDICEVNTGAYCFAAPVFEALTKLTPSHKGEYYLVDVLPLLAQEGRVDIIRTDRPDSFIGINSRQDLARAEAVINERNIERLMDTGVTVVDPHTTRIGPKVTAGRDTIVHPFTSILGETTIGCRAEIGPGSYVFSSRIGDRARVLMSVVNDSAVGDDCSIGPFSHLRPNTRLLDGAKVGNFAELKNSVIGSGSKVPHHSYVGDADVGERVNIGAGVITVNYDGRNKHRTIIQDRAFVGCNSNLVAPVTVGQGAYVAAGSTITKDVPEDALAIERGYQANKLEWAKRRNR